MASRAGSPGSVLGTGGSHGRRRRRPRGRRGQVWMPASGTGVLTSPKRGGDWSQAPREVGIQHLNRVLCGTALKPIGVVSGRARPRAFGGCTWDSSSDAAGVPVTWELAPWAESCDAEVNLDNPVPQQQGGFVAMVLICPHLRPAEHGGPAECSADGDSYSKEQAFCPQPVSRDSTQPATLSSQEPSLRDREHSLRHPSSGPAEGPRADCRESLYPSNHDRMLTALKKRPGVPPDGTGKVLPSSQESPAARGVTGHLDGQAEGLTCPLLSRRDRLDVSKAV